MKHAWPVRILVLGALCWAGCTPAADGISAASPPGYPLAYAMQDCAPWDGPAIAILLTEHAMDSLGVGFPMARLMIYPREESLAGRTFRWPSDPEMAAGNRCTAEDACPI